MSAFFATNAVALLLVLSCAHGNKVHLRGASKTLIKSSQDYHNGFSLDLHPLALSESNTDRTVDATDAHSDSWIERKKKISNDTIEIKTITILHGLNETLSGDPADTFTECYMTSYNAATQIFHGNPVESMAEDAQFVVDTNTITGNDDEPTLSLVPYIKATLAPKKTTAKQPVVVYVGKLQLGSQCSLCSDDRLQSEQQGDQEDQAIALLDASERQHRRKLVYAAFRKGFYQCLKDSGKPSFDKLVKLQVRKLTSPLSKTAVATIPSSVTDEKPHGGFLV